MAGFNSFFLHVCVLGCVLDGSLAWDVNLPSKIEGLLDSCLVIPCSFNYDRYPPMRPDRVVWYQYQSSGYPLVFDKWYPYNVIPLFKDRTHVLASYKKCTLKIDKVIPSDNRQQLYPWVDPENIGKSTHRFYDKTVTIEVVGRAWDPKIMITGDMKVGKAVTVQCSVYHTCSTNPPALSLNIPLKNDYITHSDLNYGTETTLTSTFVIQRDHQTIECSVRHPGGKRAESSKSFDAKCSFSPLIISPTSNEFLEGIASKVTCTATYTCAHHIPTLRWNYGSMPASTDTTKVTLNGQISWRTISTLTLTSSAKDHGRDLICHAQFTGGNSQQTSIDLRVKRNMHSLGWSISTPGSITGLRGSCIVIPCTFSYTANPPSGLKIIWYLYQRGGYPVVFDREQRNIVSKFSGITSVIGAVANDNCSLKIDNLKTSHNQDRLYPWIDKNPITSYHSVGFSFYDKSTQLIVSDQAQKPQLSITGIPRVGEKSKVACSVLHTCISAPPVLSLNGVHGNDYFMDDLVSDGIWKRTIERTWSVKEEDKSVKCTVSHPGGQTAFSDLTLDVECPYEDIKMVEPPGETTEGVAKFVICSVSYKCNKNTPTIVWNYSDQ